MRIGGRLSLGFAVIVVLAVFIGVFSWIQLVNQMDETNDVVAVMNQASFLDEKLADHLLWVQALSDQLTTGKRFTEELDHHKCSFGKWYYSYKDTGEFKNLPARMKKAFNEMEDPHERLHQSGAEIAALYGDEKDRQIEIFQTKTMPALTKIKNHFDILRNIGKEQAGTALDEMQEDATRAQLFQIISVLIVAFIGIVASVIITRSLTAPIKEAVQSLEKMAAGDMTVAMSQNRNDELGNLAAFMDKYINTMREDLLLIDRTSNEAAEGSGQLTESSGSMSSAATQISTQVQSISSSAEELNQAQQVVSSSIEEMAISVAEVARQATEATQANDNANRKVEITSDLVDELTQSADGIEKITELIKGIADQINLLALNAAIEAAGAGDAGRGFTVVASEVKDLAEQAGQATTQIRSQIEEIQGSVGKSVAAISEIRDAIMKVTKISSTIASSVEEQSITAKEIAGSTEQTTQATGEVAKNITGIADGAKMSADEAEKVAELSRQLSDLAQSLKKIVQKFKLTA